MVSRTTIRHLLAFGWGVYGGAIVGYFVTRNKFQRIADEQVASVKETYSRRYKTGKYETIQSAAEAIKEEHRKEALDPVVVKIVEGLIKPGGYSQDYEHHDEPTRGDIEQRDSIYAAEEMDVIDYEEVDPEDLETNIHFKPDEEKHDVVSKYEATVVTDPEIPYVISIDEFMDDDPPHDKISLTYYDGDDVLASDSDEVVPNIAKCIGEDFLTKFGHRSNDKNIVYVRNERLGSDFEVALDPRSYSSLVLGYTDKSRRAIRFVEDD